jgi:hypothetical protein
MRTFEMVFFVPDPGARQGNNKIRLFASAHEQQPTERREAEGRDAPPFSCSVPFWV